MSLSIVEFLNVPLGDHLNPVFRRSEYSSCRFFDGTQDKIPAASRFVFSSSSKTAWIPAGVYPERCRTAGMTEQISHFVRDDKFPSCHSSGRLCENYVHGFLRLRCYVDVKSLTHKC